MRRQVDLVSAQRRWCWGMWIVLSGFFGCATAQSQSYERLSSDLFRAAPPPLDKQAPLQLAGQTHLNRASFVRAVLERNPSIEVARQGWRAALGRHPQATALQDPTVDYSLAPLSVGSNDVPFGQVIGLQQRFPWPGKLALNGEIALAEADAARGVFEATRLRLALMASILFDQYAAVARLLELNDEHRKLVEDIKTTAEAQYAAGRGSQQEPLQAEVELAHVLHHRVVLTSRRDVVIAQMNGLLHRHPHLSLPPAPQQSEPTLKELASSEALQALALQTRPELEASSASVRGRQSAVDLAERQYFPDFGVKTSYNSMWRMSEHQWMAGVSLNVPLQLGARSGAVDQAEANLAQARSQLEVMADQIRVEVDQARHRLMEAQHVVRLYRTRLLPTSRAQIEAAQVGYETGRNGFQALIDAERSVRNLEIEYQESLATLGQRRAELQRAMGQTPGLTDERSEP